MTLIDSLAARAISAAKNAFATMPSGCAVYLDDTAGEIISASVGLIGVTDPSYFARGPLPVIATRL